MKKEKRKILYIHGYGGSGNSRTAQALRDYLPLNYDVIEPCFPLEPAEAIDLANETILMEEIDIVVASSLGAFTALQLGFITKIVINPCLYPSKELSKRTNISDNILRKFIEIEGQRDMDQELVDIGDLETLSRRMYERQFETEKEKKEFEETFKHFEYYTDEDWDKIFGDDIDWDFGLPESAITFGVFSTNDELFSYKDVFLKYYSYNVQMIEDTHRISVENVKNVIVPIIMRIK
ncbi:hypothetical protein LJB92_03945 [Bacteroidales bacterium OttesenSCG-928-M06]|nr:hypothetical protein [Bacteroidales bacterium OttesenSCG-928-M06]